MKKQELFTVVYEDDRIVAVNKAAGVSVGADRYDPLRERLDKAVEAALGLERIYIVHRIDHDTSGLVVFAKDPDTHRALSLAFEGRQVKKRYIAVVRGRPLWSASEEGEGFACDLPLVPNGNKRHQTIVDRYQGKKSLTKFRLLGSVSGGGGALSVVEAVPETGRTHQIRAHLSALGFPLVCDELYGKPQPVYLSQFKRGWRGNPLDEKPLLARLGLHAAHAELPGFSRSLSGEGGVLALDAPLPRDMAALLRQMEKAAGNEFLA
jgi:23S rRNA pseudouridine1911/1915/1917 synthase